MKLRDSLNCSGGEVYKERIIDFKLAMDGVIYVLTDRGNLYFRGGEQAGKVAFPFTKDE